MIRIATAILTTVLFTVLSSHARDDLNPVTFHKAPKHKRVILVEHGKARGEIVVSQKGRLLSQAIRDLQMLIEATTGAQLPVVEQRTGIPAIVVGHNPEAAKLGLTAEALPIEGFAIKTAQNTVYIMGHDEAGTTWGVDEFLERFVNVRWYWPEERQSKELVGTSVIPSRHLVVKPVWITDQPTFRKRHRWPSGGPKIGNADMGAHDRHLRSHNSWPIELIVHAPHGWSKLYKQSRPEIFQLRSDGDRDFSMLCYGNSRTLDTYIEEIELQLKKTAEGEPFDRQRAILNRTSITVSPADIAVSCRCKDCRALWDDDAGPYKTASVVMATFVRKLAVVVKARWPELTIVFLPYKNYTYAPDGISFPGNVEVQICGMPGLAQHKDSVINKAEQDNIDAWIRISGRNIQNWHYSCWPADRTKAAYLFPHVVKSHYEHNRDKTVGTFINGIADHWPRQHVSIYAWLKVLWNPDFDVDASIEQYVKRMYGPSARHMRKLVHMLIEGWEESTWTSHTFSPKSVYEESYPRKDVLKMEKLLKKAYSSAKGNALVTKRLDYYARPLREFFAESKQYADGTGIRTLNVYQVAEDPRLDGDLEDSAWRDVPAVPFVMAYDKVNTKPEFTTTLKAVWSRRGITFGFHMAEPTPEKLRRDIGKDSRDASLMWWNDNVEIFLDVTGQRAGYYQIIVNANGAIYDGKGKDLSWTALGTRAAASVGKDSWSLEVFVPVSDFTDAVSPGTGVQWYGNFTRHRVTDKTNREYQRLNTTFAGPSNDQNAFGPIRFIER